MPLKLVSLHSDKRLKPKLIEDLNNTIEFQTAYYANHSLLNTIAIDDLSIEQIRRKIDNRIQVHSLRCKKCNDEKGKVCRTMTDLINFEEILFP